MMEGRTEDGMECALRCYAAMQGETDLETRISLWRAMGRYARRDKVERADRRLMVSPLPRARVGETQGYSARDVNF
jgi:hypothetical protein